MSFLNKLFKKKETEHEESLKKVSVLGEKREEKPRAASGGAPGVLVAPHVTEKTANAASGNKYVFLVAPRTNKQMIKRAVESRYGVKVEAVNITRTYGKERRRGQIIGWKPGIKKAAVTVKEGQKIEMQ